MKRDNDQQPIQPQEWAAMKPVTALLLLLSLASMLRAQEENTSKTIKITQDSFSKLYPAVWFSPSDGKIAPLTEKSEKPPKPEFKIWIEPQDPEIATLDSEGAKEGRHGFQLIGKGEAHYESAMPPTDKKLTHRIPAADLNKPHAVFLYVDGKESYAMLIEAFSKEKQGLVFRWKALGAD